MTVLKKKKIFLQNAVYFNFEQRILKCIMVFTKKYELLSTLTII